MLTFAEKQALKLFWRRNRLFDEASWSYLADVMVDVYQNKPVKLNEKFVNGGLIFQALKKVIVLSNEIATAVDNLDYWKRREPVGPRPLTTKFKKESDTIYMAQRSNVKILAENFILFYYQEVEERSVEIKNRRLK